MKNRTLLLGMGLLLLGALAYARTVDMKVNIPFDFVVNGTTLPGGEYSVQGLSFGDAISIRRADNSAKTIVLANQCESKETSERSKLVFRRYGDHYFLARIWMANDNVGKELPKGRLETELARNQTGQDVILLAALR